MSATGLFYIGIAASALILLICYHKTGRLLRCVFFTAFTGLGTLGILWIAGRFIISPVDVTPFTALVSGVLGIPGVVCMLILHLI